MAKSMKQIRIFRRGHDRAPCRNPTVSGRDYIIEVQFQPHYIETGAKMVTVTQIYHEEKLESVRTEDGGWERKVSWSREVTRNDEMTPDEANKVWAYCISKGTTRVPEEIR